MLQFGITWEALALVLMCFERLGRDVISRKYKGDLPERDA